MLRIQTKIEKNLFLYFNARAKCHLNTWGKERAIVIVERTAVWTSENLENITNKVHSISG